MLALEVARLKVSLFTRAGMLDAVDGMSFAVASGETVALVGESGCGKSLTALSLMRLLPDPPARIVGGMVRLAGIDLLALSEREMQRVRSKQLSMIFQDPVSSLNPVVSVGRQLVEVIRAHTDLGLRAAVDRALELLDLVRIADPRSRFDEYPHRLSGGMCQRVMIAIAIACGPKVLIADEPTTALDVTVQAQVLALLERLQHEIGMAMVFITHDLGVVAQIADRVAVMYAGRKVEEASAEALFAEPLHPYTRGLLGATRTAAGARGARLVEIPGAVPSLAELPAGCAFAPRCPLAGARCLVERPVARALALQPKLVICDEPVSALDVSIRAQVVNLLADLKSELGVSYIFVSHDLSVVEHVADRVMVMYLGRVVETGTAEQIWREPRHPYTKALLAAVPVPDPRVARHRAPVLAGELPSSLAPRRPVAPFIPAVRSRSSAAGRSCRC